MEYLYQKVWFIIQQQLFIAYHFDFLKTTRKSRHKLIILKKETTIGLDQIQSQNSQFTVFMNIKTFIINKLVELSDHKIKDFFVSFCTDFIHVQIQEGFDRQATPILIYKKFVSNHRRISSFKYFSYVNTKFLVWMLFLIWMFEEYEQKKHTLLYLNIVNLQSYSERK